MHTRRRGSLAIALVLSAIFSTLVANGAVAADDLSDDIAAAKAKRAEIQTRLDQAAEQHAALETRKAELESQIATLRGQQQGLQTEIDDAEAKLSDRVRELYKGGNVDPVIALVTTAEPAQALERAAVVVSIVRGDRAAAETATAKRTQVEALSTRVAEQVEALAGAVAEQEALSQQLQADLAEAQELEEELEAEARRRAEEEARRKAAEEAAAKRRAAARSRSRSSGGAPAATTSGGWACPVANPRSFTNTWGAPRSGGRRHQGTDILAPYGNAVYAITSGVVDVRGYGSSAGNWLILRGSNGEHYYYMHLQSFSVGDGTRVSAGQPIARNGDTGNARGTPHVHFERHPGGGAAVNPYSLLRSIC